ncbi:hypothetical protein L2E82_48431 [Cichorium intybus]|uniref:Uncharacterized protein n=1 Tax=Cichorium intybus TaxID=13427 RepID=A0ACB8YYW1_CICIN|nr:hypothetical protein L2E82_48431 [Cichorium intybus]
MVSADFHRIHLWELLSGGEEGLGKKVPEADEEGERCNWRWIVVASTEVAMKIMTELLIEPKISKKSKKTGVRNGTQSRRHWYRFGVFLFVVFFKQKWQCLSQDDEEHELKLLEVKGFDPNGKVKIKNTCSIDLVNSVLEDMLQRARIIHSDEVYFCFGGIDGSQRVQFYSPRNELESLGTDSQSTMSYEINVPSLDDIRDVLNPRFSKDQVLQPHKNQQCSSAVDGYNDLMFPENLSRLTTKYFLSLAPPRTLPSEDKFRPFSLGEPTLPPHQHLDVMQQLCRYIENVECIASEFLECRLCKGYATARYKCGKKDKEGAQELILLSAIIKKYRASSKTTRMKMYRDYLSEPSKIPFFIMSSKAYLLLQEDTFNHLLEVSPSKFTIWFCCGQCKRKRDVIHFTVSLDVGETHPYETQVECPKCHAELEIYQLVEQGNLAPPENMVAAIEVTGDFTPFYRKITDKDIKWSARLKDRYAFIHPEVITIETVNEGCWSYSLILPGDDFGPHCSRLGLRIKKLPRSFNVGWRRLHPNHNA